MKFSTLPAVMDDHPPIQFRLAEPRDSAGLAALTQSLYQEEGRTARLALDEYEREIGAVIQGEGKQRVVVAELNGELVGFVMGYAGYDWETMTAGTHLADLYVKPDYRRHGVATNLLGLCANHGEDVWMSFTVSIANDAALNFYQALGAVMIDARFMALNGDALASIRRAAASKID